MACAREEAVSADLLTFQRREGVSFLAEGGMSSGMYSTWARAARNDDGIAREA